MTKKAILIRNAAASDFGGGEKVPVYIAREVSKHDIETVVFSSSKKLLDFASIEHVKNKKTWWLPWQNWSGARVILTPLYIVWQVVLFVYYLLLFIKFRPTIVHIQGKDDFIAGTIAAKSYGARVIWSDYADLKHIWKNVTIWYKNPIGKMVLWASRFTDEVIVVSKEDLRLITANIPSHKILKKMSVVYYGAFDNKMKSSKSSDDVTFISTSRLVTDKGVGELIDAFQELRKVHNTAQLLLVGDGPEREKFENKAKTIPGITFTGLVVNPIEYLAKSDVFVLPTYHEGFSIALVEACMQGLPIIATRIGGNVEIIKDDYNGVLIPKEDVKSLFEAMKLLFEDSKLRKSFGENARSVYEEEFDFKLIIEKEFVSRYSI